MKALDVARYLIALNDKECADEKADISKLKLQKLLYYTQGYYSALYDKPLFEEEIQAWQHGPVVKEVYQEFRSIDNNFIPTEENKMSDEEIAKLDKNKRELIEDVFYLMGQYSAWKLRDKTHEESPWKDNYKEGEKDIVIPKNEIKKYFKQYVENDDEDD